MTNLKKSFKSCDDFASYVLDSVLDFGSTVNQETNELLGTDFPVGTDLFKTTEFPDAGKNYDQFGTVKSWLYDIYELNFKTVKATTKTSTAILKKYIAEKYGMKVSAKSDKYSGGSSLNISYDLGLNPDILESDLSRLERGNFNGMEDIYEYKNDAERGIKINGVELDLYSYVFVRRDISDNFRLRIAQAFFIAYQFSGIEVPETVQELHESDKKYLEMFGVWSRSEYLYRVMRKFNFLTNDESQIGRIWFEENHNINRDLVMHYEMSGKVYTTDQTEIKKELETVTREATIILNDVKMIDYSEKAVAVLGSTYEIKDDLKALGGKYNRFLTVEGEKVPGWIFSKAKADDIANILIKYAEN